jgi:hypothetical protein
MKHFGNNSMHITYEKLKSKILAINIYYDELGYTNLVEYEKVKLIDLVSSIGGTFGLFVGVSFLSCAEIIDLSITICLILRQQFRKTE